MSEKLRCRSNLLRCWSDVELSLTDIDFALLVDLDLLWLEVVTGVSVMESCLESCPGRMLRRLSVSDRDSPLDFLGSVSDFPAKWILCFRMQTSPTYLLTAIAVSNILFLIGYINFPKIIVVLFLQLFNVSWWPIRSADFSRDSNFWTSIAG